MDRPHKLSQQTHNNSDVAPTNLLLRMLSATQASMSSSGSMKYSPIPFPWKLHEMLGDASGNTSFDAIVSWLPEHNGFRVHDVKKFVDTIMPRYFNQTKYKSFQRQLNMWGFERILNGPFKGGYTHECFVRGEPDLCCRMRRQKIKGVLPQSKSRPQGPYVPNGVTSRTEGCKTASTLTVSAAADIVAELVASGGTLNKNKNLVHSEQVNNTEDLFGFPLPLGSALPRQELECLEFEGRNFFDVFEDKYVANESKNALTTGAGTSGNLCCGGSRRFSLEFLVSTHF